MGYYQEGSNSLSISSSDIIGQHNKIEVITFRSIFKYLQKYMQLLNLHIVSLKYDLVPDLAGYIKII